MPNLLNIKTFI